MKKMKAEFIEKPDGLSVRFRGKDYGLIFPPGVWSSLPGDFREFFTDNFAFLKTVHLPFMFGAGEIELNRREPLLRDYFMRMQLADIPATLYSGRSDPKERMGFARNARFSFSPGPARRARIGRLDGESCVISFSFGKDSLLTLAAAREIGLEPHLVMSEEKGAPIEFAYKKMLSRRLGKEFGLSVEKISNETMTMHDYYHFGMKNFQQYSISHLITEYVLLMVPFACKYGSKHLFLGNERSCNFFAHDKHGNKCYPVFDQSAEWNLEMSRMLASFGGPKVSSLLEPLNDLGALKILYSRYPEFAKYQYSCFPDESRTRENGRWCGHCSKCARLFIFMKALGIDAKKAGFAKDMLGKDSRSLYPIFSRSLKKSLYDDIGVGRSEQIYAFYLACKNGVKGPLIDEFRKKYLEMAKGKEDEWHREYFSVHPSVTIPKGIKRKVYSVYREELGN